MPSETCAAVVMEVVGATVMCKQNLALLFGYWLLTDHCSCARS